MRSSRKLHAEGWSSKVWTFALPRSGNWRLDIFSSSMGMVDEFFREVSGQPVGTTRFVDLLTQQSRQIPQRGALARTPPLRQRQIGIGATGAVSAQTGQQQQTVASDDEGGVAWDRLLGPHLGLADAQPVFFFAMIDLDLPAIKVSLQQTRDRTFQVRGQQISGVAVVGARLLRQLVRLGRHHDQPQGAGAGGPLPQHPRHQLVANPAPLSRIAKAGALPGVMVLLADLLGRQDLSVLAALASGGGKAQPGVLAAAGQQGDAFPFGAEHGAVAIASIQAHDQRALVRPLLIQLVTLLAQQRHGSSREVVFLLLLAIVLLLLFRSPFARFADHWRLFKANGQATGVIVPLLVMRKQQAHLDEPLPPTQIDVEGRRQGIPLPAGTGNLFARPGPSRVVDDADNGALGVALEIVLHYRLEEGLARRGAARTVLV